MDDVLKTKPKIRWIAFLDHDSISSTTDELDNKEINYGKKWKLVESNMTNLLVPFKPVTSVKFLNIVCRGVYGWVWPNPKPN